MISNYYTYDFEKLDGSTNITKRMISKKIKISLTRKNYYFKVYTVGASGTVQVDDPSKSGRSEES